MLATYPLPLRPITMSVMDTDDLQVWHNGGKVCSDIVTWRNRGPVNPHVLHRGEDPAAK